MLRSDKVRMVEGLAADFAKTPNVFLASYRGLTANQSTELRRRVRIAGGTLRVVKNRLAKRASAGTGTEKIRDGFAGMIAVAAHESDPVGLAKVLTEFAKDNPQLDLLSGVIDAQQVVDAAGVKQLSSLPGLPELRAQLLALVNTPATMLVRLLNTPGGQVARAIDARRENLEGGEG